MSFRLPSNGHATMSLYDVGGRRVFEREVGSLGAGSHTVAIGEALPAGIYVIRLAQGGRQLTTRAAVIH